MSDTPATTVLPDPASPAPGSALPIGKAPSIITFAVGILLFLLPFVDVKCNNTSLATISGMELATGFKLNVGNDNTLVGKLEGMNGTENKANSEKRDANPYALAALVLGIAGLVLSLLKIKAGATGGLITGVLSAGALIGLYIDVKRQIKTEMNMSDVNGPADEFGKQMSGMVGITVDFTPYFYLAILAFLGAAFFCYKRMKGK